MSDSNSPHTKLLQKLISGEWNPEPLFQTEGTYWYHKRQNRQDLSTQEIIQASFLSQSKNRFNQILDILNKTKADLYDISPLTYTGFTIFGSPDSRDIDLLIYLPAEVTYLGPNDYVDLAQIRQELVELCLPHAEIREIDYNLVTVDENGDLLLCSKGDWAETQNIAYYTHHLHTQKYPCPIKQGIPASQINPENKFRAISRYYLDNLKHLLPREIYEEFRANRREAYDVGISARSNYVQKIYQFLLARIQTEQSGHLTDKQQDFFKSIVMKLCQLVLLVDHQLFEFNKTQLAQTLADHDVQVQAQELDWYLSLGERGQINWQQPKSLNYLMKRHAELADVFGQLETFQWTKSFVEQPQARQLLPNLSPAVRQAFLETPNEPTEYLISLFIQEFQLTLTNFNLSAILLGQIGGLNLLGEAFIQAHVETCVPRSQEWLQLLRFYRCGRNTGVVPYKPETTPNIQDKLKFYWHLVRGILGEMMAEEYFVQHQDYQVIQVGFLTEHKGLAGARAIAPDLILYQASTRQLIPVEIKCLSGQFSENRDLRREAKLARKQLETSYQILQSGLTSGLFSDSSQPIQLISSGLLVVIHLDNDYCHLAVSSVD